MLHLLQYSYSSVTLVTFFFCLLLETIQQHSPVSFMSPVPYRSNHYRSEIPHYPSISKFKINKGIGCCCYLKSIPLGHNSHCLENNSFSISSRLEPHTYFTVLDPVSFPRQFQTMHELICCLHNHFKINTKLFQKMKFSLPFK